MWTPGSGIENGVELSFYDIAESLGGSYAIHRLMSFMRKWSLYEARKKSTQSDQSVLPRLVIDSEVLGQVDDEYRDALSNRLGKSVDTQQFRISLFDHDYSAGISTDSIPDENLMASAIITRISTQDQERSLISDCIVRDPSLLNNYLHLRPEFERIIRGRPFKISGTYFCQQDGLVGVCAHAAAVMYLANHPKGIKALPSFNEINKQILKLEDSRIKILGSGDNGGGLSNLELVEILRYYNLNAFSHNYKHDPHRDYASDVYAAVESGKPALLAFETAHSGHVVVALGHTLNTDLWLAEVKHQYFGNNEVRCHSNTCMWVEDFLVHDDNFGMLLCLPTHCLSAGASIAQARKFLSDLVMDEDGINGIPDEHIFGCLATSGLKGKALSCVSDRTGNVDGSDAEIIARNILYDMLGRDDGISRPIWFERLREVINRKGKGPVLRSFQTTKIEYIEHLRSIFDRDRREISREAIEKADMHLPHTFWHVEVTLPDLFTANGSKLGEVIISDQGDANNNGDPQVLGVRLPGRLWISDKTIQTGACGYVPMLQKSTGCLTW
jgi:hypothetical protein